MMGARLQGREKRTLGDFFGLSNFGVNLTKLAPKAVSSLFHSHSRQDELICILRGHPVLQLHEGRVPLTPGMCAGFKSGSGHAHCLINESNEEVLYLEIGDRTAGDEITYPNDDLQTRLQNGRTVCLHKDGSPY